MFDGKGRFVPTANCELEFRPRTSDWKILGWGNGDPAFQYVERPLEEVESMKITTFNGHAQVILQKK